MIKPKSKALFFFLVLGTVAIMIVALQKEKTKEKALVQLNARVAFDGNRFMVSNNDTVDYLNAEITVNGYYKITDMNLRAGETYTFWPVEFSHMNGNRLTGKQTPLQFAIWCKLHNGGNGYYSVKFNDI